MVESIYFLKPAWCGTHFAGLWPEQGLQPVTGATALRRWFVTRRAVREQLPVPGEPVWMKYAGFVATGDPHSSQSIDELVYGTKD